MPGGLVVRNWRDPGLDLVGRNHASEEEHRLALELSTHPAMNHVATLMARSRPTKTDGSSRIASTLNNPDCRLRADIISRNTNGLTCAAMTQSTSISAIDTVVRVSPRHCGKSRLPRRVAGAVVSLQSQPRLVRHQCRRRSRDTPAETPAGEVGSQRPPIRSPPRF